MNLSSLIYFFFNRKDKYKILLFLPGCVKTRDVYNVSFSSTKRNTYWQRVSDPVPGGRGEGRDGEGGGAGGGWWWCSRKVLSRK